jgi:hypothetical protein
MSVEELLKKRMVLNDVIKLFHFLLDVNYDPLHEEPTLEFLVSMASIVGIAGDTEYIRALTKKFKFFFELLKENLSEVTMFVR